MRLRAELEGTKRLLEISRVLMKVSKSAIILLSPSSFRIAINDSSPTLMKCWVQLSPTGNEFALFRTYKVESKNANQIAFEIDLSSFERALRTAETSNLTTIKLAKRDDLACLSFESTSHVR
uniref:Checkpoint protein n=1 Tax=Hanusia phi TaxID=3032 RepID=A0A7S0F1I5_9CRYP|mmetsp:Transcript_36152/g.81389  ORF Transcript_36152/g.81389 Transcript_36152/m.81389 type:complete len:122 (+) Transcript_36152:108-473(+)